MIIIILCSLIITVSSTGSQINNNLFINDPQEFCGAIYNPTNYKLSLYNNTLINCSICDGLAVSICDVMFHDKLMSP